MSLLNCTDCRQPVSSEAHACPACGRPMRDRSYLTPMGQLVIGGIVLIACLAWPPLFLIVCLVSVGRLIVRAGRGSKLSAFAGGVLLLILTVALASTFAEFAFVVMSLGIAAAIFIVVARVRTAGSTA